MAVGSQTNGQYSALFLLTGIVLAKGADLGVKALYVVVATLFISLVAFFAGQTEYSRTHQLDLLRNVNNYEQASTIAKADTATAGVAPWVTTNDQYDGPAFNQAEDSPAEPDTPISFSRFLLLFSLHLPV